MGRARAAWQRTYNSFWFVPGVLTLAATVLAVATVAVDRRVALQGRDLWLVFGTGAEGARGVLSAISGSMITVTGVVFSMTIVALQLAAQQFTPRVLRVYSEDRGSHLVLGTMVGTFTYALLVERTVRSERGDSEAFVPVLSVNLAVVLTLVSIAALLYFIHHVARSIQAERIVDRVARDVFDATDRLFPETVGEAAEEAPSFSFPEEEPVPIRSERAGYLQSVDEHALFELADQGRIVLRMEPRVGDYVLRGDPLVSAWIPIGGDAGVIREKVNRAFLVGPEKTLHQDVSRGVVELVDIAVKALSPGTNDPTTAMLAIDRLGEVVTRLGTRAAPSPVRTGKDHRIRFVARRREFAAVVELAFGQVRHYGGDAPAVMIHLTEILGRAATHMPAWRREPLRLEVERIRQGAEERIRGSEARQSVEAACDLALARIAGVRGGWG